MWLVKKFDRYMMLHQCSALPLYYTMLPTTQHQNELNISEWASWKADKIVDMKENTKFSAVDVVWFLKVWWTSAGEWCGLAAGPHQICATIWKSSTPWNFLSAWNWSTLKVALYQKHPAILQTPPTHQETSPMYCRNPLIANLSINLLALSHFSVLNSSPTNVFVYLF